MEQKQRIEEIMKKYDEEHSTFREWFKSNWLASGGLIPKATAAKLLGKCKGRITQMVKEGKLNEHRYNSAISFLEAPQIFTIMHKEAYNLIKGSLLEEAEKLPETHRQSFIDALMPTMERQEKEIDPIPAESEKK